MKVVPIIVLLFASSLVYCQTSKSEIAIQLDSLKSELKLARNDSMRANILEQLTMSYARTNPDSAIHYGEQAFELAININNKKIAVSVLGFIGDAYHSKGNLPKGLEVCLEAIALSNELRGSVENSVGPAYSTLGDIHTDVGNYRQALSFYSKLLIPPIEKDELSKAFGHFGRASVYEKMNMLDSALYELGLSKKYFDESSVDIANRSPKIYPVNPNWFNLRSRVYVKQGKIDLALLDLTYALNMTLKNDEPYYSSNSYNDIALLYADLKTRDSAIYFAKKGLQEANRISYTGGILVASEILADQLDSVNDTEALYYLKLAKRMRNQLYGASNIQLMKDMIAQNAKRQQELANTEAAYQNKLKVNGLLGLALILTIITIFLIRNNRNKQKAKRIIESAYADLKSTQSQLIHSEKMASLGELIAGIAHEIQNPLNFVNNFSEVSEELVTELKEELINGDLDEAKDLSDDVIHNLQKIKHHGQRASDIVKGMLQHSRSSNGQKEPTDVNALADEYLRLAYHGLRAKDKSFNAEFKTELDPGLPMIMAVPQDIGRVLLNLINNAFYVVDKKAKEGLKDYKPLVAVSTKKMDDQIEIMVRDNGEGIPKQVREKIFQPFFTTKPTGQGTGLGLSMSYDIVTKGHGGTITLKSHVGQGTEFVLIFPIK
jgi:two-component system, NtrC family, sensor kinase